MRRQSRIWNATKIWKTFNVSNHESADVLFSRARREAVERYNEGVRQNREMLKNLTEAALYLARCLRRCEGGKNDCVGHAQKRMGKHLLKLKSNTKGKLDDGKTIGGKGRLTEAKIKQFQRYYGPFSGHDESSTSLNKGNYRELLQSFCKLDAVFDRRLNGRLEATERPDIGEVFTGVSQMFKVI